MIGPSNVFALVLHNEVCFFEWRSGKRLEEYEGPYWALRPNHPPFMMYTWKSGEGRHYSGRCPF